MLDFDYYRELRNGRRYTRYSNRVMNENGSVEENRASSSSENTEEEFPEFRTFTEIKGFIAPVTRQLEELTRLVQGIVTTLHPSH